MKLGNRGMFVASCQSLHLSLTSHRRRQVTGIIGYCGRIPSSLWRYLSCRFVEE